MWRIKNGFWKKAKQRSQRFASDSWIMHFLLLFCDRFVFLVLIFWIIYKPGFRSGLVGLTLNVCTKLTWLEFRTWGDLTIPASVCVNAPSVLHVWYSSTATRKWVNPKSTICDLKRLIYQPIPGILDLSDSRTLIKYPVNCFAAPSITLIKSVQHMDRCRTIFMSQMISLMHMYMNATHRIDWYSTVETMHIRTQCFIIYRVQ